MCIGGGYHVNVNEVGGEFCSILYGKILDVSHQNDFEQINMK